GAGAFPVCSHGHPPGRWARGWSWMASEPFRLFFFSGALWSVAGVSLWIFYYAGMLTFYPGLTHARIMMENFGGGFVVGFLGTAGPRMLSGPRLSRLELVVLFSLHMAGGMCHWKLMPAAGDGCFAVMLGVLVMGFLGRAVGCWKKGAMRPQLALALAGLGSGMTGALLLGNAAWLEKTGMEGWRLAGLLLYQGFLLLPVMGMGSFLFPRILGGGFGGEEKDRRAAAWGWLRAGLAAGMVLWSFRLEASGWILSGYGLRIVGAGGYLAAGVPWRGGAGAARVRRGTLAKALYWSMALGLAGLVAGAVFHGHHVAAEHLLYMGGFGLVILVAASRVLFGHSGDLPGFSGKSWQARTILTLTVLAATTRASADLKPSIMISHHLYAALLWAGCVLLWMVWHGRRWMRRDDS
ncbi:MAG: hypothetical protein JWL81_15, partial [Verrucomicrobiales bacterium]|nr:hypothetical protein [Verrucomicrobiales bacterium]